ncbi:MAG: hypothetical protein AB8I08_20770 [Sandaracinaceae bacterium]
MSGGHTIVLAGHKPGLATYLGGQSRYPIPEFGDACVCCGVTPAAPRPYDPSLDRQNAQPLEVPTCHACERHVVPDGRLWQLALLSSVLAAAATVLGGLAWLLGMQAADVFPVAGSLSGLGFAIGGGVFMRLRRRRARLLAVGHHPFDAIVGANSCVVRTTSDQLADTLLALNPKAKRR